MASDMTKNEKDALKTIAQSAQPYDDDSPEMTCFDYGGDFQRMLATLAQKALEGKLDRDTAQL